jgi:putative hydrolase
VDGHTHTKWTDGADSVEEMWKSATSTSLDGILFSEHSSLDSGRWFGDFCDEVRSLPKSATQAFVGTECRISSIDGKIDLDPFVAKECDLVIASVHRFPTSAGQKLAFENTCKETAIEIELSMMIAALEREEADVIGHPFGMSITRFKLEPRPEHWSALVNAAANSRTALEVNSKYHSRIFDILDYYRQEDCRVSLGSDAHAANRVGHASNLLMSGSA